MANAEITKAIREILPAIKAKRDEIEAARRMPADIVEQMIGTKLFSLPVPKAIGGPEAEPSEMMHAIETIASADGSAGWIAMIGMSSNTATGYMNEEGAREVVPDMTRPAAALAGPIGAAIPVDGGYQISGRWSFASGIDHCDWVWLGCIVMEDGAPKMTPHGPMIIHAWTPTTNVTIHDTWFVSGLRGTGSNDVSCESVFVPAKHVFSLFDPSGHRREPLYSIPVIPSFTAQVSSVSLGIARGALDELIEIAGTKVPTLSQVPLADKAVTQVDLARAEAAWGSARAFLHAAMDDLWRVAQAGGAPTPRQNALARTAAINAVEVSAQVTATVNALAGGSALYDTSAFQRHVRDAEAIKHHFTVAPHVWEDAGRVLLGRDPTAPLF